MDEIEKKLRDFRTLSRSEAFWGVAVPSFVVLFLYCLGWAVQCGGGEELEKCWNGFTDNKNVIEADFPTYLGVFTTIGLMLFVTVLAGQMQGTVDEHYRLRMQIGLLATVLIMFLTTPVIILSVSYLFSGHVLKLFLILPLYIALFVGAVYLGKFNFAHPQHRFQGAYKEYVRQTSLIKKAVDVKAKKLFLVIVIWGLIWSVVVAFSIMLNSSAGWKINLLYSGIWALIFALLLAGGVWLKVKWSTGTKSDALALAFLLFFAYLVLTGICIAVFMDTTNGFIRAIHVGTILLPFLISLWVWFRRNVNTDCNQSSSPSSKIFSFIDLGSSAALSARNKLLKDLDGVSKRLAEATIDYQKVLETRSGEVNTGAVNNVLSRKQESGDSLVYVENGKAHVLKKLHPRDSLEGKWFNYVGKTISISKEKVSFIEDQAVVIEVKE